MAKVELIPQPKEVERSFCTLTITKSEAEALLLVCGQVTGSFDGPRGKTSDIYHALIDLGLDIKGLEIPKGRLDFKL